MNDKDVQSLISEISAVKKLLILQLLGQGFQQRQIAAMLEVSEATMSRMLPKGLIKTPARKGSPVTVGGDG